MLYGIVWYSMETPQQADTGHTLKQLRLRDSTTNYRCGAHTNNQSPPQQCTNSTWLCTNSPTIIECTLHTPKPLHSFKAIWCEAPIQHQKFKVSHQSNKFTSSPNMFHKGNYPVHSPYRHCSIVMHVLYTCRMLNWTKTHVDTLRNKCPMQA